MLTVQLSSQFCEEANGARRVRAEQRKREEKRTQHRLEQCSAVQCPALCLSSDMRAERSARAQRERAAEPNGDGIGQDSTEQSKAKQSRTRVIGTALEKRDEQSRAQRLQRVSRAVRRAFACLNTSRPVPSESASGPRVHNATQRSVYACRLCSSAQSSTP